MVRKFRYFLWRVLGVNYDQALRIHDYVYLKNDPFTILGQKTYENGAMVWRWTDAPLVIGKFCSIANNVRFIVDEGYHSASDVTSFPVVPNFYRNKPILPSGTKTREFLNSLKQKAGITIGNDVWIGMGSLILPGVKIGNGVTIGANAVVNKDLPDYCVAAGNPARVLKMKFDPETIETLNRIAWWDWSEELIAQRAEDFYLGIDRFIEKYS